MGIDGGSHVLMDSEERGNLVRVSGLSCVDWPPGVLHGVCARIKQGRDERAAVARSGRAPDAS